jgi:hypothetical protein
MRCDTPHTLINQSDRRCISDSFSDLELDIKNDRFTSILNLLRQSKGDKPMMTREQTKTGDYRRWDDNGESGILLLFVRFRIIAEVYSNLYIFIASVRLNYSWCTSWCKKFFLLLGGYECSLEFQNIKTCLRQSRKERGDLLQASTYPMRSL